MWLCFLAHGFTWTWCAASGVQSDRSGDGSRLASWLLLNIPQSSLAPPTCRHMPPNHAAACAGGPSMHRRQCVQLLGYTCTILRLELLQCALWLAQGLCKHTRRATDISHELIRRQRPQNLQSSDTCESNYWDDVWKLEGGTKVEGQSCVRDPQPWCFPTQKAACRPMRTSPR